MKFCESCHSVHMGLVPCGLSYSQRLRSAQLSPQATPSKTRRDYFDDEPLKDVFGKDKHERKEQLMEETGGHGFIDSPKDLTPAAARHFGLDG